MLSNNLASQRRENERPTLVITENKFDRESNRKLLLFDLNRAVKLGSLYRESVIIWYTDKTGQLKKKDTIVLTITERYVILKGGTSIPIENVEEVIL